MLRPIARAGNRLASRFVRISQLNKKAPDPIGGLSYFVQ